MPPASSAAALLRSVGLDVDGPGRWGANPPSRSAGIFVIEAAAVSDNAPIDLDEVRRWLERVPDLRMDGERPTQSTMAVRLASFWIPGQTTLYVGRTAKALGPRVAALYATELGHGRPHPGGHWLKALREQSKLRLWWAETDAPEEYEDEFISAFAEGIDDDARAALPDGAPVLPWANLDSPTSPARETGLAASLLSAEATPVKPSGVKRSDRSGSVQKRSASATSSTPRSPRRSATKAASTPPSSRERPTHVTADGLTAMEAELARLTTVERPLVVERVKHARELGDLRENADYEAARNEQSFLEGRVLEIQQQLRTAVVISAGSGDSISMGSTVRYEIDGEPGELTIVGSTESDPAAARISAVSPVGKALLGHRAGDDVVVPTPVAKIHYRIVEVG